MTRAAGARAYRHTTDVDQTMIPRAVPGMIGQKDATMSLSIEGEILDRDRSRTTLAFNPGSVGGLQQPVPVTIVRDGADIYAEKEGKRERFQANSPIGAPTDNMLDYLAAAENARDLEPVVVRGVTYRRVAFDLRGATMVANLTRQAKAVNPNALVNAPESFKDAAGSGEVWIGPDNLPKRQNISLDLPQLTPQYNGRVVMRSTFSDFADVPLVGPSPAAGAAPVAPSGSASDFGALFSPAWLDLGTGGLRSIALAALFVFAGLLYVAVYRRNRTRAYKAMVITLASVLFSTAPLQALAADINTRYASGLPSLTQLLGLGAPLTGEAAAAARKANNSPLLQSTSGSTAALIQKCGDGSAGIDTDGDGLSDLDEGCLGTSPYSVDSDVDQIPDRVEVTKFTVGTQQWASNPLKVDSNEDGLNDLLELPATPVSITVNSVLTTVVVGNAPVKAGSPATDWDNDGVPNVWDEDNDGDGVNDALDLSPFSVGQVKNEIRISSQNATYTDTTQYIELQLQPANPEHLRYGLNIFDWPATDEDGPMQNISGTNTALVNLQPFLEVMINEAAAPKIYPPFFTFPEKNYAREYGVNITENRTQGYRKMYMPLQRVGNGGAVNAFYTKIALFGAETASVDLRARLVWFVSGDTQAPDSDPSILMHTYKDEQLRVTGIKTTRSGRYNSEYMITGVPDSPSDDFTLMQLATGLNMFFLGAGQLPYPSSAPPPLEGRPSGFTALQEFSIRLGQNFSDPTVLANKFNLTRTLPATWERKEHPDEMIQAVGKKITPFLNENNFAGYFSAPGAKFCNDGKNANLKCASLLIATDERNGSLSQEDLASATGPVTDGGNVLNNSGEYQRFEINANNIVQVRRKSLKLGIYENIGTEWKQLDLPRSLAVVYNRYESQRNVLEPLIKAENPDLTWTDGQQVIFGFYLGVLPGVSTVQFDNESLAPDQSATLQALAALAVFGGVGPGIVRLITDLHESAISSGNPFQKALPKVTSPVKKGIVLGGARGGGAQSVIKDIQAQRLAAIVSRFEFAFNATQAAAGFLALFVGIAAAVCGQADDNGGTSGVSNCDAAAIGNTVYVVSSIQVILAAIDLAYKAYQIVNAVKAGTALSATFPALKFVGNFGKLAGSLAIIGFAIGAAVLIAELALTIDAVKSAGLSFLYIKLAIADFIGQLIWALVTLILTFIPGVGQIIAAILAFIDALVAAITGGSTSAAKLIVRFFYDIKVGAELKNTSLSNVSDNGPVDQDKGLTGGNKYRLSQFFGGRLVINSGIGYQSSAAKENLLAESSADAFFVVPSGPTGGVTWTGKSTCFSSVAFGLNEGSCNNLLSVTYPLTTGVNRKFEFRPMFNYKSVLMECTLGGLSCWRGDSTTSTFGDKDENGNEIGYQLIVLDVLPPTLEGFLNWDILGASAGLGLSIGPDGWRMDSDGDGLLNTKETAGLSATNWDTDADGLSDKFELDNGLNPRRLDLDGDGLNDGDEIRFKTATGTADSDSDGLFDGFELTRRLTAGGTLVQGGWDVTLPSGRVVRVYSDPLSMDADFDNLLDSVERDRATSPWAVNVEPGHAMNIDPFGVSPTGNKQGVYVAPGRTVTITLGLDNFSGAPVNSTLTLCVPSALLNIQGGFMTGNNHVPARAIGACGGGTQYSWNFGGASNLLFAEVVSATVTAVADPSITTSRDVTVTSVLPLNGGPSTLNTVVHIDADLPVAEITSLSNNSIVQRPAGGGTLIVGGTSSDPTSWVTNVDLNTGSGFAPATDISPWAFAWTLPPDGVYTLQARATDFVGNTGLSPAVSNVIVDGTAPTATLSWTGAVVARPAANGEYIISGSASDNLAGLQRIEVSIDGFAFRGASFTPGGPNASVPWNYTWKLPSLEKAQGTHVITVRARDRAGNYSQPFTARLAIDALAPSSELTTRQYFNVPAPVLRSGVAITLNGRASDLGNQPLPPSAGTLIGNIDALDNATVLYSPDGVRDGNAGVSLAWASDIDGDSRADYVAGFPAANNGAGRVNVVYGRAGDFRAPPNSERLSSARAEFIGAPGAGIGQYVTPVGDINADGYADVLIGDAANQRSFLVFGRANPMGTSNTLVNGVNGSIVRMTTPLGVGATPLLAPAGDVNEDGVNDLFVGAAGATVNLIMGRTGTWQANLDIAAEAAMTFTMPLGGRATGAGDVNGDGKADFVIASGNQARLYSGSATFVRNGKLSLASPIATFASADANPTLAPLGDINGDGLADFAFGDANNARVVLGRAAGGWAVSHSIAMAAGFIAGLGDINADGRADFAVSDVDLFGAPNTKIYFGAAGAGAPSIGATVARVSKVAAAPLGAGADLNCDASADLLTLPSAPPANLSPVETQSSMASALEPLRTLNLLTTSFGYAGSPAGSPIATLIGSAVSASNVVVDDNYCSTCGNDGLAFGSTAFADIQSAVNAVPVSATINVLPGVYGAVTVNAKNGLVIKGINSVSGDESVFVDGAGGAFAVRVSGSNGVQLSNMVLRNAQAGLDLVNAGVNGSVNSTSSVLSFRASTLLVHSFTAAGMQLTRNSTAVLNGVRFFAPAGGGPAFNIVGAADATPANKLTATNTNVYAPFGSTIYTWFVPSAPMADFNRPNVNLHDGGGATMTFTPSTTTWFARRPFLDEPRNVYIDFALLRTVYVSPDYSAPIANPQPNVDVFRSIQAAINSGAVDIRIQPGVYREAIYLADGVSLSGVSADNTTIELPDGATRPVVQADGVRVATLRNLTINGRGGVGISARSGADLKIIRSIVRDNSVGVSIDGASSLVDIANTVFARNGDGVSALNNAQFRVRNSAFYQNSGAGLSFQSAAATQQHEYNNYFGNGAELRVNGAAQSAAGVGENAFEPLFNSPVVNDFRPAAGSALINAGNPGDPSPVGTGRIDIGYSENSQGGLYVNRNYSFGAQNDGLQFGVNAFDDVPFTVFVAKQLRQQQCAGQGAACNVTININVAPGNYTMGTFFGIDLSSGIRLLGSGADVTTITGNGGTTPIVVNGSGIEISGFTVTGASVANQAGVDVAPGSTGVVLRRNVIRGNSIGVRAAAGSGVAASNNTIVGNGTGLQTSGAAAVLEISNNIVANNTGIGVQATAGAVVRDQYNLYFGNATNLSGVTADATSKVNVNPNFVNAGGNNYALQSNSPAIDVGDPRVSAPAGGGKLSDIGYREVLAAPITLIFGRVGSSCALASSGVASVDVGNVTVLNAATPLTGTLPSAWQPATLANPNAVSTDWTQTIVPTGDGLRRLYSRATDVLGNQEVPQAAVTDRFGDPLPTPELNVYDGAYYADSTPPTVSWATSSFTTAATSLMLQATVTDVDPAGNFSVQSPYMIVDGQYVPARFLAADSGATTRTMFAFVNLNRGQIITVTAYAPDAAGNLGVSGILNVSNIQNPDPTVQPGCQIEYPINGSTIGGPLTQTVRGKIRWSSPFSRFATLYIFEDTAEAGPLTLSDPFGTTTDWSVETTFIPTVPGGNQYGLIIFCGDANGNQFTGSRFFIDGTPPLIVSAPPNRTISQTTVLGGGSATDPDYILLDRVEMSGDNGATWATISQTNPVSPAVNTAFSGTYTPPGSLDFVNVPVQFRAVDTHGNSAVATTTVTVDNVPPALAVPTFNIPVGSYLDSVQTLVMSWPTPTDGSTVVNVTASFNQISKTLPTTAVAGTSATGSLNANGEWYAHISAVDALGNRTSYDLGPWFVASGAFCSRPLSAVRYDGVIDTDNGEWKANMLLDDDERPFIANEARGATQSLYGSWDANAFNLGWLGATPGADGTLFAYFSTGGAGLTTPISPTNGVSALPFAADLAVAIYKPGQGTLYRVVAGVWQAQGALQTGSGAGPGTEARVPFGGALTAGTNVRLFAYARSDDGDATTAFPTTNPLTGAWAASYNWAPICSVADPNAGQPSARNVAVSMVAVEPDSVPYPPNGNLNYVITVRNYELRPVSNAQINLSTSTGLTLQALTGPLPLSGAGPAGAGAWSLVASTVPTNSLNVVTATARLASNLAGVSVVTATMAATQGGNPAGDAVIARRTDAIGPDVSIDTKNLQPGSQVIGGDATDGDGIGVALVEINIGGAGFVPVSGTAQWNYSTTIPSVASLSVQVRATDLYGNVGPVQSVTFVVDNLAPTVDFTPPAVFTSGSPSFAGTAFDPPTGGPLTNIGISLNGAREQSVQRTAQAVASGAPEPWDFALGAVVADGRTYTATAYAVDAAGNKGASPVKSFIVDNVGPRITTTLFISNTPPPATGVTVLQGTVTDGSGVASVVVRVNDPNGNVYTETATLLNGVWTYAPQAPLIPGPYTYRVFATDIYGNTSNVGAYDLNGQPPTGTPTPTPTPGGPTPTPTATQETPSPSPTVTPSASATAESTGTSTATVTVTATVATATASPTASATATVSATVTNTPQPTETNTATPTATNTPVNTPTPTPTPTETNTATPTATNTPGNSPTPTASNTPVNTATPIPTNTATRTPTPTVTATPGVGVCVNNLLLNGSFELARTSTEGIRFWSEIPFEGAVLQGGGYQADGANGAFVGPFSRLYQEITVTAGRSYTLTFWAGTHDPGQNETVQAQFFSAGGSNIGSQVVNIDYDVDLDTTFPRVTQYSVVVTAPANAAKLRVLVRNNGTNIMKFDAACLTDGAGSVATPTATPSKTPTATGTPVVTLTPTKTPTKTATPGGPTPTKTATPTKTPTATPASNVCVNNKLLNGGFEQSYSSSQGVREWIELPNEGAIAQGGGYQAEGANGAFIGPNERMYQDVTVTAGVSYTLTFWAGTHDPAQNETVQLQYLNATGSVVGSSVVNIDYDVDPDTTFPRVTQYSVTLTAPVSAVKARVLARNTGNNTFKLDAVCFK